MKISFEVKEGNKSTNYTADFEPMGQTVEEVDRLVKGAAQRVSSFLKTKFVKVVKETKEDL